MKGFYAVLQEYPVFIRSLIIVSAAQSLDYNTLIRLTRIYLHQMSRIRSHEEKLNASLMNHYCLENLLYTMFKVHAQIIFVRGHLIFYDSFFIYLYAKRRFE